MRKVKHNIEPALFGWLHAGFWAGMIVILFTLTAYVVFEKNYQGRIYPHVSVGNIDVAGKSPKEVETYWLKKNTPFAAMQFELRYDGKVATISGDDLGLGYDATLSATQAFLIGRSRHWLSDIYFKLFQNPVNLSPYFRWNKSIVEDTLNDIASQVDVPATDALFQFQNGRVTSFRPSRTGRGLNIGEANARITQAFYTAQQSGQERITILIPVETVKPTVATDQANTFGIKELIGSGYSQFAGSIAGRIHNIALAADRINGILVKPGETFSFNDAVGDISAATGYQSAYIIKEGRTVLGDGGGVCQVSTTLFRAALAAGLPIVERYAHAYRVHYYEEGGYKPGLDATVYSPTYDLKFKNDTPTSILIQTRTDIVNLSLAFDLYGLRDGRKAYITNQKLWDVTQPPPDLYQDDPTLAKGVVKQVDFAAWGAKASFEYLVTRGTEVLENTTFVSTFRPWQAVYLKGTL
jgi:vancomycin resistance protein YoaR